MKNQRGQTLLIILLSMVVSLTVGLAIAARSISSLRETALTAQSTAAYHAAEGGVEEALAVEDLSSLVGATHTGDLNDDGTDDFSYTVAEVGAGSFYELPPLEQDQTAQVDLDGYPNTSLDIYWVLGDTEEANRAALEIAFVYEEGGSYKIQKYAYDPDGARGVSNNFSEPLGGGTVNDKTYNYHASLTAPAGVKLARLRSLYNSSPNSVVVRGTGGNNIPGQGYKIRSEGRVGKAIRVVEVTRTKPALPAIFDYVLFSGSETTPLSK